MRGSIRAIVGARGGAVRGAGSRGTSLVTGTARSRGRDVFRVCETRAAEELLLPVSIASVGLRDGGDGLAARAGGGSEDVGGADAGAADGFGDLPVSFRMNDEKEDPDRCGLSRTG